MYIPSVVFLHSTYAQHPNHNQHLLYQILLHNPVVNIDDNLVSLYLYHHRLTFPELAHLEIFQCLCAPSPFQVLDDLEIT